MRARQGAVLDTARKVQAFLDAHAAVIGPSVTSARRNLDDAAAQLAVLAATQAGSEMASKGTTVQQRALVSTLRQHYMRPVSTVAKLLLSETPEIGTMAVKTRGLAPTRLVAAAKGIADSADKYAEVFKEHGLPDDFTAQLRAAADAVTAAMDNRQQVIATARGSVAGMKVQEARVRAMIRLFDSLVLPKLGADEVLRSEWATARAIESVRVLGRVPTAPTQVTGEATSTTAPLSAVM